MWAVNMFIILNISHAIITLSLQRLYSTMIVHYLLIAGVNASLLHLVVAEMYSIQFGQAIFKLMP